MSGKSRDQIAREWDDLVNMSAPELEKWLDTEDSHAVGNSEAGESTGHASGRRIVKILRKDRDDCSDSDWEHMTTVVGYIKRHCAIGGPADGVADSRWRYSLMNWGHNSLASGGCAKERRS